MSVNVIASKSEILESQGIYLSTNELPAGNKTVFLFTGHGSQYPNMMKELSNIYPVVKDTFDEADEVYRHLTGRKLTDVIFYENEEQKAAVEKNLTTAEVMQPSIIAANMAMYRLMKPVCGEVDIHLGHSLGEIAALAAAGVFSFADALKIAFYRANSLNRIDKPARGTMLSLKINRENPLLAKVLEGVQEYHIVSLHNSPEQVVISGTLSAIEAIAANCETEKVTYNRLAVSHAFHSKLLEPAVEFYYEKLKEFKFQPPKVKVFSTILGDFYNPNKMDAGTMASVLSSQLVKPFSFCDIVSRLNEREDANIFIEVGPKDILTKLVKNILKGRQVYSHASNVPAVGDEISLERVCAYLAVNRLAGNDCEDTLARLESDFGSEETCGGVEAKVKDIVQFVTGYPLSYITISGEPAKLSLALNNNVFKTVMEKIKSEFALDENEFSWDDKVSLKEICSAINRKLGIKEEDSTVDRKEVLQPVEKTATPAVTVANAAGRGEVEAQVKEIIELKTGYPVDMLEGELDLEADLGIDSVKQAEIFVQIRDRFGYEARPDLNIKQFNTINKIVDYTLTRLEEMKPTTTTQAVEATPSVQAEAKAVDRGEVEAQVKAIIEQKTGYPVDMLEGELDLEADLGIDSVKQAEIFVQIRDKFGYEARPDLNIKQFNTINKIVDYTISRLGELTTETVPQAVEEAAAAPVETVAADRGEVEAQVKAIIEQKTGYPVDMLEGELDLEADLGIDSVKQAEIFVQIRERFGYEARPDLNIKQFNTINKIVDYTISRLTEAPSGKEETKARELSDEQLFDRIKQYNSENIALRYVPVTVEREYDATAGKPFSFKNKNFIIIEDRLGGEITSKLTDILSKQEAQVCVLSPNPKKYKKAGIKTDYDNLESFKASLEKAKETLKDVHGFIYLYPLSQGFSCFDSEDEKWYREVDNSFNLLFYTAKAVYEFIEKHGEEAGCFAATGIGGVFGLEKEASNDPMGAVTAGFFKSMEKEIKPFNGKVVDFTEPTNGQEVAETLFKEFSLIEELIEIGYVNGRRKTICVLPSEIDTGSVNRPLKLGTEDVIVVSGGGRGIIFECIRGLAEVFNPTIIVTGRTPLPQGNEDWLNIPEDKFEAYSAEFFKKKKLENPSMTPILIKQELEKLKGAAKLYNNIHDAKKAGLNIHYMCCDVASRDSVRKLAEEIKAKFGKITGIVNGAGLPSFGKVPKKPEEYSLTVVRVKANGFYNLYREFEDQPLKFFASIGSVSGRFGMDGQVDYAAGADIIVRMSFQMLRKRPELKCFVMGWTAWDEVGMATDPQVQKIQKEQRGLEFISVREGIQRFLYEITCGGDYPEVLYYGSLGTNRPLGQMSILDEAGKNVTVHYGKHGEVSDRIKYPLLQRVKDASASTMEAEKELTVQEDIYLKDHLVEGKYVFAGVMHIEAFSELATLMNQMNEADAALVGTKIYGVEFSKFVKYFEGSPLTMKFKGETTARDSQHKEVRVEIRSDFYNKQGIALEKDRFHSAGNVVFEKQRPAPRKADVDVIKAVRESTSMDIERFYALTDKFITFGPSFRCLDYVGHISDDVVVGQVTVPDDRQIFSYTAKAETIISPITIDNIGRCMLFNDFHKNGNIIVPRGIGSAVLYRPFKKGEKVFVHCKLLKDEGETVDFHAQVVDENNNLIFDMMDLHLIRIAKEDGEHNLI